MAERRYYWIKIKSDFFDLPTIDWLQDQKNGCEYIVLYQKLCLLSANSGGELVRRVGDMVIPYDAKKISEVTRFKFDTVVVAMGLYKKIGLIVEREDGVFIVAGIGEMVGSETKWAEKKRLQRDKGLDNVPRLSQKNEDKKGQCEDIVPLHVPENVPENKRTTERTDNGTSAPTLSGKSIEIRDQSIDLREKSIEIRDKEAAAAGARAHERDSDLAGVVHVFENNIHPLTGEIERDRLIDLTDEYGSLWIMSAIEEAALSNGRSLRYITSILERWKREGFKAERKKGRRDHGTGIGQKDISGNGAEKSPYAAYFDGDTVKKSPYDLGGTSEEGGDPADDWSTPRGDPQCAGASSGSGGGGDQAGA